MKQKVISKTVLVLSLVSMFTDVASEMLYPVMPVFLKSIGFSVLLIGILEGVAEVVAGLGKGYFGALSDKLGNRILFVRWGYFLSALSKPLFAITTMPFWIFGARTIDRVGKGIRTGARDALLSDEATPQTKGRVFGFHRGMDTLGAVLGPVFALIYLWYHPQQYNSLFLLAFIPGIFSVGLLFRIKEKPRRVNTAPKQYKFSNFIQFWKNSTPEYRKLATGLLFFSLFNSSDYFLLLKLKESNTSFTEVHVIGAYVLYNLIYAFMSYPLGKLGDKFGLKNILLLGMLVFSLFYLGMAFNSNYIVFIVLFIIYGVYAAATEGISKAWITIIINKEETATAIGTFTSFQSICSMLASTIAGTICLSFGYSVTFIITAIAGVLSAIYLFAAFRKTV